MPRASTTSDAFNAVAEPRRRQIIDLLSGSGAQTVGEIGDRLQLRQPAVSKHLGVLRKVGLVTAIRDRQHRRYSLNPAELKTVHDWVKTFERFWTDHLDAIKVAAEEQARGRARQSPDN